MDLERVLWEARPALFRYAISLCRQREEAEDLVQTAFVRAWERAGLMRERGADACRAYLFKVVHNAYIDRLRKRRPELPAEQGAGRRMLGRSVRPGCGGAAFRAPTRHTRGRPA